MPKKRKHAEMDQCPDNQLHCLCRQRNDENKMMMQCDFCDGWFHPGCVDLDDKEAEELSIWHCPGCVDVMTENPCLSKKGKFVFVLRKVSLC